MPFKRAAILITVSLLLYGCTATPPSPRVRTVNIIGVSGETCPGISTPAMSGRVLDQWRQFEPGRTSLFYWQREYSLANSDGTPPVTRFVMCRCHSNIWTDTNTFYLESAQQQWQSQSYFPYFFVLRASSVERRGVVTLARTSGRVTGGGGGEVVGLLAGREHCALSMLSLLPPGTTEAVRQRETAWLEEVNR